MKGYVYSIRSHLTAKIYIGSTQSPLSVRMAGHRKQFKAFKAGTYTYVSSYDILEFDDAYIECIEVVEFNDKAELRAREGHFQRIMECVNRRIERRTQTEYYVDNAATILEKQKQYKVDNVELVSAYQKQYYTDNAEAIKKQQSEIITCQCGKKYTHGHMSRHFSSAFHIKAMAALTA